MKQKTSKKTLVIFFLVLAACLVAGFFTGFGIARVEDAVAVWQQRLAENAAAFLIALFALFAVYNAVLCGGALLSLRTTRKQVARWDGEDETAIEQIERRLNLPLLLPNIAIILNAAGFLTLVEVSSMKSVSPKLGGIVMLCTILVYFLSFAAYMVASNRVVNLEKQLNPEKRGSVFEFRFNKHWYESCDEAERQMTGRACLSAYKASQYACLACWIVSMICQFLLKTGVLPILLVCAIWLAQTLAYFRACMKLEGRKAR